MFGTEAGRMRIDVAAEKPSRSSYVGAGPRARPAWDAAPAPVAPTSFPLRSTQPFGLALLVLVLLANSALAQEASNPTRPNLARQRSGATTQAKGSQGWWLGTAAALVVLAGAGALCLAARGKAAGATASRLQVLGRVHLPPRHALFLVRAGRRTLLIGTGPQGAPSLLGELDDEETEPSSESIGARLGAAAAVQRGPRAPARFDVQLGDEP